MRFLNHKVGLSACAGLLVAGLLLALPRGAHGQDSPAAAESAQPGDASIDQMTEEALNSEVAEETDTDQQAGEEEAGAAEQPSMDYFRLLMKGGYLMIPIGIMSVVVVAFSFERALALRRGKVMPSELIHELGEAAQDGNFDPRKAYRLCQKYPSTAATVIRAMLLKVGRPHAEVEHSVAETSEREAARLYSNVRTLTLAAAVTPLLGLLGTVLGMIEAFFVTANLPTAVNKAEHLANGIYKALVTTAAGLAVAIPAAVLAHFFEGRIQSLLRRIDELLFGLLPQVERFEGKLRVSRDQLTGSSRSKDNGSEAAAAPAAAESAERKPRAATSPK